MTNEEFEIWNRLPIEDRSWNLSLGSFRPVGLEALRRRRAMNKRNADQRPSMDLGPEPDDEVDRVTDAIERILWTESFDGTDERQRAMHREAACAAIKSHAGAR